MNWKLSLPVAAVLLAAVMAAPLAAQRTLNVLVFADAYHYGPAGHELARALDDSTRGLGLNADFTNTENVLSPKSLNRYDVLVLFNHNDITRTHEKNITDFVRAGGGLVALHHIINKANGNPELTRLVGAFYEVDDGMIGHRDFNIVRIEGVEHPVLEGIPEKFMIYDDQDFRIQFYPGQEVNRLLSCDIRDNGEQNDCGWTRTEGAGRVVFLSPGDPVARNPFVNNEPLFQLILNSIRWTAGN
ncbi:MAG: ThuA domain-containing protein [Candidatus Glassbacteria bacterium]|nr:ThuA domain-containing protein [Candidatus Glassbacteria bacterium]